MSSVSEGTILDVRAIRRDFPILTRQVHGHPLVYLDNAATTQKPQAVIDAELGFYREICSNVHRGVHELSGRATEAFETARGRVRRFLGAADDHEIIFVRGVTEGVNLVAQSWGRANVGPGDEILITAMEHHSNIVPWQMLCQDKGATLKVAPINDAGEVIPEAYAALLGPKTRLVAMVHQSNSLGTVNPVRKMIEMAHVAGALTLVDGAQAVAHRNVDVRDLATDFYVMSGHKVYGPTGIGVLYGRAELLEAMPPWQGGGDMILSVTFERSTYNQVPFKFEAGTPNVAGAIGLGAAIAYLDQVGLELAGAHEAGLLSYATEVLTAIPDLRIIGTAREKASVISFVVDDIHPHDIGTILDGEGIALRTGHHCTQPVMDRFGVAATVRASFAMYNTREEVDALAVGLGKVIEVLG
ncbi:MAG: cysteine desulfurase [Acidobacteria bacterium]|nr:cysteine desulfurase [Acidobacteriota bacterium]